MDTCPLIISTTEGVHFFNTENIIRLEARSNYTVLHFTDRKPLIISKILGEYEEILSRSGFIRTHRSHLVNARHVSFIDSAGNIIMQDRSRAEISRRRKKEVMKMLKNNLMKAAA